MFRPFFALVVAVTYASGALVSDCAVKPNVRERCADLCSQDAGSTAEKNRLKACLRAVYTQETSMYRKAEICMRRKGYQADKGAQSCVELPDEAFARVGQAACTSASPTECIRSCVQKECQVDCKMTPEREVDNDVCLAEAEESRPKPRDCDGATTGAEDVMSSCVWQQNVRETCVQMCSRGDNAKAACLRADLNHFRVHVLMKAERCMKTKGYTADRGCTELEPIAFTELARSACSTNASTDCVESCIRFACNVSCNMDEKRRNDNTQCLSQARATRPPQPACVRTRGL